VNLWNLIYRVAWIALGIVFLAGAGLAFVPKWEQYRDYRRRHEETLADIRLQEEMINLLKEKQDRFRTDPRFVERIGHDLGLARPGEVVFRFRDDDAAGTNRPPPPPPNVPPPPSR
jgi:hypothetical protein